MLAVVYFDRSEGALISDAFPNCERCLRESSREAVPKLRDVFALMRVRARGVLIAPHCERCAPKLRDVFAPMRVRARAHRSTL